MKNINLGSVTDEPGSSRSRMFDSDVSTNNVGSRARSLELSLVSSLLYVISQPRKFTLQFTAALNILLRFMGVTNNKGVLDWMIGFIVNSLYNHSLLTYLHTYLLTELSPS
jgi:hypothetical protein